LLPRYWSPLVWNGSGEIRFGVGTTGNDPLLQHLYGLDLFTGSDTHQVNARGFYQYDRFLPTLLVYAEDVKDPQGEGVLRTRRVDVRVSAPFWRTIRTTQTVSLTWRREEQTHENAPAETARTPANNGGLELAWLVTTEREYPYSISPSDGFRARLAWLREDPALGSDRSLSKLTGDVRGYFRLVGERDVLALHAAGGYCGGSPEPDRPAFAVGGYPDSSLFDLVRTNLALLRGYPDNAFTGQSFLGLNLEYRFPLFSPQHGYQTAPAFVRHVYGEVFGDAGNAWNGAFRFGDLKPSAGVGLGSSLYFGHRVPITANLSVARGFAEKGTTRVDFRLGLAF
jgi:outer membrane protein assembly factor BamA